MFFLWTTLTEDLTLYAQWTKVTAYTLTYDLKGGSVDGWTLTDGKYSAAYSENEQVDLSENVPTKDGATFAGWYRQNDNTKVEDGIVQMTEDRHVYAKYTCEITFDPGDGTQWDFATDRVDGSMTLYARWSKNSSGGSSDTRCTLSYESNGGTEYKSERYAEDRTVVLDKVPTREGYSFTGWYADKELTEKIPSIKMNGSKTVYAGWRAATVPDMLDGDEHFAYVIGYSDGLVHPTANISRAETAAIFFRLLKAEVRDGNLTSENSFADVTEGMWCNKAVSTVAALGIFKGRTASTFAPSAPITRAEFAAICARFDTGITDGDSNFTDISGHWAEMEIERAASLGWVRGYTDGRFGPNDYITRAEAMTMINRVLCRIPEDEDDLRSNMNVWPDNRPGDWYYLAVQEATNSHGFTRKGEVYETWTALTEAPDWTRYQD